jgi:cold shock CspA family protein
MNVVLLVGRVSDRPFRPGNAERLVVRLDVPSPRRSTGVDEIEIHCFGAIASRVEGAIRLGDTVEVRGRVEHRIGHDDQGEYDDIRIVADDVSVLRAIAQRGTGEQNRTSVCDGTQCTELDFLEGVVKTFRAHENYGFIGSPNLDGDVFFLGKDMHNGVLPKVGDTVRFVLQARQKGHGAIHISVIEE